MLLFVLGGREKEGGEGRGGEGRYGEQNSEPVEGN
jgi:hypothetical protein